MENKIACIKAVRGLAQLGLKEAKDLVERVTPGHAETIKVHSTVLEPRYTEHIRSLREAGITVQLNLANSAARTGIADEIRRLVTYSTMAAQFDIAKALLDVMETYCPDPAQEYLDEENEKNDKESSESGS